MISKTCRFSTERLIIGEWHSLSGDDWEQQELPGVISRMLTDRVTQSLPEGWQGAYSAARARDWIEQRDREGATLLVIDRLSRIPLGLMILFESDGSKSGWTIHMGYLLSESCWGKGLASELVRGFVDWCRKAGVTSIVGGVDQNNVPSQRVLEKNGFVISPHTQNATELFYALQLPGRLKRVEAD